MNHINSVFEFQGLLGWGYYLIMLPFRFTYYTILDIFRYVPLYLRGGSNRVGVALRHTGVG